MQHEANYARSGNWSAWVGMRIAAIVLAVMTPMAASGIELAVEEVESRAIRVDDPTKEPLRVALEPVKDSFEVDEPIRFNIRGNKTFFLYLFSIDDETGDATLILPTKEGQEHNKYPADRTLPVPNEGEADFLSDTPGRETVVMVASTKYLPVKSNWFRDGADSYVGKAKEFEQEFADKGIRVGEGKTRDEKVHVKRLAVRIRGEDAPSAPASNVWLTTQGNRQEYALGERINAVFGAGEDGWVQVYVVEPTGKRTPLKSYAVEANKAYTMKAIAEDPVGKHAFVAFYSKQEPGDGALKGDGDKSMLDASPKGVRLVDDAPRPVAVYRFRITDD